MYPIDLTQCEAVAAGVVTFAKGGSAPLIDVPLHSWPLLLPAPVF